MLSYKIFVTDDNVNNIDINTYKFLDMTKFINLSDEEIKTYDLLLIIVFKVFIIQNIKILNYSLQCFIFYNLILS